MCLVLPGPASTSANAPGLSANTCVVTVSGHCTCVVMVSGHCSCVVMVSGHCSCVVTVSGHCTCVVMVSGHCTCVAGMSVASCVVTIFNIRLFSFLSPFLTFFETEGQT